MKYELCTDEQLIAMLRAGDSKVVDYIMEKYKNLVRKEANTMYLFGGDNDDLIQEGMIGLFKALQDYDSDKEASFYSFAKLCVKRQLYTAIEASNRKKHQPLNSYISLSDEKEDSEELLSKVSLKSSSPEDLFIGEQSANGLMEELEQSLSSLESRVLYLHLMGTDYKTIARLLDKSPKTIDNALQRIKMKTREILNREKS